MSPCLSALEHPEALTHGKVLFCRWAHYPAEAQAAEGRRHPCRLIVCNGICAGENVPIRRLMKEMNTDYPHEKVPKFIGRLYRITQGDKYKGIRWTSDGLKIHVHDRDTFVRETMPIISKTKEFGTFVRMLNSYGFHKAKELDEDIYFCANFRRGREDLLPFCKREEGHKAAQLQLSLGQAPLKEMVEYLYRQNGQLYVELNQCKEQLERHERTLNGLLEVLSRVFKAGAQDMGVQKYFLENQGLNNGIDAFLDGRMDFSRGGTSNVLEQEWPPPSRPPELSFKPKEAPPEEREGSDEFYENEIF
jgi:heat shock transcription factor, other eukaryote